MVSYKNLELLVPHKNTIKTVIYKLRKGYDQTHDTMAP